MDKNVLAQSAGEDGDWRELTSVQEAVWLDQMLDERSTHYNIGFVANIEGALDVDRLERAIAQVAAANDALRLVMQDRNGSPRQSIAPAAHVAVQQVDLSGTVDAEAAAWRLVREFLEVPFALEGQTLWRTMLVRMGSGRFFWAACFHHLVNGGFGTSVFYNAVADAYNNRPAEKSPSYLEFLSDDCEYLRSRRHEVDRNFWRERFAVAPAALFRPKPGQRVSEVGRSEKVVWTLPRPLFRKMRGLVESRRLSMMHFMLALLAAHFGRARSLDEIVIGIPVHNRSTARAKMTVGMFSSVLPVKTRLRSGQSLFDVMHDVARELRQCYRHQRLPIPELNRILGSERQGRQPFDILLSYESFPCDVALGSIHPTGWPIRSSVARTPLTVFVQDYMEEEPANVEFHFNTDLLDRDTVEAMVQQLRARTEDFLLDPESPLGNTGSQQSEAHPASRDGLTTATVHALFERQAAQTPAAVAVSFGDGRLTYSDLHRLADRLAGELRRRGVGPDVQVALHVDRGFEAIIGILGVWLAGGCYVPLDPTQPKERLRYMLADCRPRVLLTQRRNWSLGATQGGEVIVFEDVLSGEHRPAAPGGRDEANAAGTDHLAYVLYTSGSTGQPKAVAMPHAGLANLIDWHLHHPRLCRPERTLQFAALTFDVSIQEIATTLCCGGTLVLPHEDARKDMGKLAAVLGDEQIGRAFLPPVVLQGLAQTLVSTGGTLPLLRDVITAGEPLRITPAIRRLFNANPLARLHNHYGPTETHVVTAFTLGGPADSWPGQPPIGTAIQNTEIYILDEALQAVQPGSEGEIYVAGAGLARGYLNREELTAEVFTVRPIGSRSDVRLYRTGDIGKVVADGVIECLGRSDRQIKMRGFRVEPAEIEAHLLAMPQVRNAAVVAREEPDLTLKRLVAYVVWKSGEILESTELRDRLGRFLPGYMIPSAFVTIEHLPLTPHGKLDLRALPAPEDLAAMTGTFAALPRGPVEQILRDVWCEVLNRKQISVHDNFFELGGHSLLATQVMSRISHVLQVRLPLRVLFEAPTIAGLAQHIESGKTPDREIDEETITSQPRTRPLPVSFSQRRMWFVQQVAPESTAYNMPFALRLRGKLNRRVLAAALKVVTDRHEAFHTTFGVVDGEPVQIISVGNPGSVELHDLRSVPREGRDAEAARMLREIAMTPFDLSRKPLYRFVLLQLDDAEYVAMWLIHHAIGDQWSAGIILGELAKAYRSLEKGAEVALDPLPFGYADYAAWQRSYFAGDRLTTQLNYWRDKVRDLGLLALPLDKPRPVRQSFRGSHLVEPIPQEMLQQIRELCARLGVTPFMVMLACFKFLLMRYTGQEDIAVGSPIANRARLSTEKLVGTLVNTLVMRTDLGGDPTFAELAARIRETALEAYENQDLPFERLVEEVTDTRDLSYSPLVQVLFNVVNAPVGDLALGDLACEPFDFDSGSSQFDLSLTVETELFGRVYLSYSSDLFDAETARRMMNHYMAIVRQVAADPDRPLSRYALLDEAEKRLLLHDWIDTGQSYPELRTDQLIAAHAKTSPSAVAVRFNEESLTYASLDERANRLARFLQGQGVCLGSTVGVCLERTPDLVITLLAVMKCGGAYVPLDPTFPKDRLQYMARDAGLSLIVAHSKLSGVLPEFDGSVLFINQLAGDLKFLPSKPIQSAGKLDELAYVLYTSGSTGKPKGVEISHRALVNFLCSMQRHPGCGPDDRLLAVTTLSFDIAGLEIYLPLVSGGEVVLVSGADTSDGRVLKNRIRQARPTIMQATPATWRMLISAGWQGNRRLRIFCGGEALPSDLAAQLLTRCRELWNLYGPTETTIWSTVARIAAGKDIDIGRPISNTQVYILDARKQLAPIGVTGELYIGGLGLARGYRNRPELTQECFTEASFEGEPSQRLYRTGDLARYRADGHLVHLGRRDFQVKIRGYRIEPAEVEACLALHPAVGHCIVTSREDADGMRQLVAYVRLSEGSAEPDREVLRAFVRKSLPDYMTPTQFVFVASFPLTANGKIDVKALPAPVSLATPSPGLVNPRGRMEVQLTALWRRVLEDDSVGVTDNFFDRGGHSLKAAQLMTCIEQVMGRRLPLATLFEAPTIAEMASILSCDDWRPLWRSLVAIQPAGDEVPIFAVPGVGGNVLMFERLSMLLGRGQPFYALQARGLDEGDKPFTSITQMATHYVEEMRSVRPMGPYIVVGTCTGGVTAFEMARQLRLSGETATLVMLETWHPSSARSPLVTLELFWPVLFVWSKLINFSRLLARISPKEWPAAIAAKLRVAHKLARRQTARDTMVSTDYFRDRVSKATWYAVSHYRPKPLPGKLVYFIASNRHLHPRTVDTRELWLTMAMDGGETGFIAAKDSGDMLVSPHVEELASQLRRCIE